MTEISRKIASRYTGIVLSLRGKDQDIAIRALLEKSERLRGRLTKTGHRS